MNKIDVIIPAFNEQQSIGFVLDDIPAEIINEIVVVNNNSTDSTAEAAEAKGATVLFEPEKGYGWACLRGIEYLKSKSAADRPDIVVFLDADYSDYPQEIVCLVKPIVEDGFDLVIGSRMIGKREKGAMLPQAVFGNFLATLLIKLFYSVKFTDLGPFRAIKYGKLIELDMKDRTFGWTVEMQVKAARKGFNCIEVPVSYRKRIGVSKITGTISGTVKAGYKIIWTIIKYL
ncbi:MAG: glycosyltransferase family 2 protein [Thermodesulfobacteriota bacterium]